MADIKAGDWIQFVREGRLVVGVVAHLPERPATQRVGVAITYEHGSVRLDEIIERRSREDTRG